MKIELRQSEYDEVNRLKKKLHVIEHTKKPKYWGDQWLIMRDFFDELNDEFRYLYFGGMLSDSQVNVMYGKMGPISKSLSFTLDQYLISKLALSKAGKDIEDELLRGPKPATEHRIYH